MKRPARQSAKDRVGATLTPAEIKRAWDKLRERRIANTEAFIAAGRGHERPSDYLKLSDPLSVEARKIADMATMLEVEAYKYAGRDYQHILTHGGKRN